VAFCNSCSVFVQLAHASPVLFGEGMQTARRIELGAAQRVLQDEYLRIEVEQRIALGYVLANPRRLLLDGAAYFAG
jgi:hypothetical protein